MSLYRKRELAVLRYRKPQSKKVVNRTPRIVYYLHWIYPTFFVVSAAIFITVYLCQCAQIISVQYRIGKLKQEKNVLLEEQKKIKLQIEELEALERIEKIARNDLKMVYPSYRHTLNIKRSTITALNPGESLKFATRGLLSNYTKGRKEI